MQPVQGIMGDDKFSGLLEICVAAFGKRYFFQAPSMIGSLWCVGYQLKPGQPIKSTSCVAWQFSTVTPKIVPA